MLRSALKRNSSVQIKKKTGLVLSGKRRERQNEGLKQVRRSRSNKCHNTTWALPLCEEPHKRGVVVGAGGRKACCSFFFFSLENESLIVEPALFCFSLLFFVCFAFLCSPSPTTLVSLDCHNYGVTLTSEISCFFCLRHLLGSHQHILLGKPIFYIFFSPLKTLIDIFILLTLFFPLCVCVLVCCYSFSVVPLNPTPVFLFFFFLRYGDCSRGRKFEVRQRPKADIRPFFLWIFCFFFFFLILLLLL